MSYVKNYNVGQTKLDLPYANYIHELPLLSFGDVQHTINLSLVFNYERKAAGDNPFNIASGFKLNMQKKLRISGDSISYQEESGKLVNLTAFGDVYTFNDDSQRILRRTEILVAPPIGGGGSIIGGSIIGGSITPTITEYEYVVEYPDYSKEEYNSNGYITGVYDKYGTKFLSYSYDGTKLTDITYRNTKNIDLKYDSSNRLSKIIYGGKELVFNCANNPITITQRSVTNAQNTDASYSLDCSGQNLTVTASGQDGVTTHTYKKVCEMNTNSKKITVSYIVGTNTVNFTTYEFVDGTFGYSVAAKLIDVINYLGVKTRLQYNDNHKLLYSYEYNDADDTGVQNSEKMFVDNRYTGNVNLYKDGYPVNVGDLTTYYLDNGASETGISRMWDVDLSAHESQGGCYLLTGWIKGDTTTCTVSVYETNTNFEVNCIPGEWMYFTIKLANTFDGITVSTALGNYYEAKDLRITYVPHGNASTGLHDDLDKEEGFIVYNSTVIPLASASIHYRSGNTMAPIIKVSAADVIKYKLNKLKNKNTSEIYYNKCKSVRTGASGLFVLYNGQYIDVKDLEVRKKIISGTKEYTTVLTNNTTNVFVENLVNNVYVGTQKLNLNLNVTESTSEGINTYYEYVSSTCSLISKQTTAPVGVNTNNSANANVVIVRQYNYDSTNPTKITSIVDEFGNTIEYTTDDTWGVVTGITVKDSTGVVQSIITDNYDDDKCALVSREFSNATNARNTAFTYSGGNLTGLTDGTISYDFAYSNGDLTSVSRDGTAIETHTVSGDRKVYTSTYDSHSIVGRYDNYGRLTKVDNVVENAYDVMPTFDEDSGDLITKSANGSAVLATSKDLTNNQLSKYHYNDGRLESIETKNSSGTVVSEGMFTYDDIGRLSKDTFTYDNLNGKYVESDIGYQKAVTDPMADGRISTYSYKVQGAQKAHTANTFDVFNRVGSKEYTIDGMKFTKNITYTKTRPTKIEDNFAFNNLATTTYGYDAMGRISSVNNGKPITYEYDEYGQLVRENNKILDKTFQYEYNGIGNIESVNTYAYTPQGTALNTAPTVQSFTYDDNPNSNTKHPDRLTAFGSKTITYNSMGCPTSYDGKNFMWYDGKLSSISKGSGLSRAAIAPRENYFYTYNAKGQRTHKDYSYLPVDLSATYYYTRSINTEYAYDNAGRLIRERRTYTYSNNSSYSLEFIFLYDESGMVGVQFKDGDAAAKVYYYQKNLQGDVVAIYDTAGAVQAKYSYDAFGNCSITNSTNTHLANYNPIRYRGYYFDDETGWYYLNTRYYSPEWRRFISPDDTAYLDPKNVNGLNLYCYCGNDPINFVDPSGHFLISTAVAVGFWIGLAVGAIAGATAGGIIAHNIAENHGAEGWELFAWTMLGIVGGGAIGGAVGAALGSSIGYGVGLLWGTAPVAGSQGAVALWSGGKGIAGQVASTYAAKTGAKLVTNTFAGQTLNVVSRLFPKRLSNYLWGKLSAEFVAGASSATIFLFDKGIEYNSVFYKYEIWVLLEKGIERAIQFVE